MISNEQFEGLITLNHEIPGVEFKGPGYRSDNPLFGRVIRAAIGMANRPEGGFIIIGVADNSSILTLIGLSQDQLPTWKYDDIADGFAAYADPPVSFDFAIHEYIGMQFAVLQVHEYPDIPIVCKKEYKDDSNLHIPIAQRTVVLRKGACYVRRRHKAETLEISSAEDMRALLDLAISKGVKKFITQAYSAGLNIAGTTGPNDEDLFKAQMENWTGQILDKIKSRGYWQFIIRPETFFRERLAFLDLEPLVEKTMVSTPGISFPELNQDMLLRDMEWIGQELASDHFLETLWWPTLSRHKNRFK